MNNNSKDRPLLSLVIIDVILIIALAVTMTQADKAVKKLNEQNADKHHEVHTKHAGSKHE